MAESTHIQNASGSKDLQDREKNLSDLNFPYSEPAWSGEPPPGMYQLLVIKNGIEIDTIDLSTKSFSLCGRLPSCDISLEHPSISRYHAVLQYRPENLTSQPDQSTAIFSNIPKEAGFYLFDLSSTHGTYLTKKKLQPRCYYRMRVGQSVKFGGSSRLLILDQTGGTSQEVIEREAEEERADICQKLDKYQQFVKTAAEKEKQRIEHECFGATWGLSMDDAGSDEEMQISSESKAYYLNDPKKCLKSFFDREGLDLEYETESTGPNHDRMFIVKAWLPVYTSTGKPVYAEGCVKGNKKEAVVKCALDACRLLDTEGVLRESENKHIVKRKNLEENDFYESDEDSFFDRTGDVERNRKRRMIKAGKMSETKETHQSLTVKLSHIQCELNSLQVKLQKHKQSTAGTFGANLSLEECTEVMSNQLDNATISKCKIKIKQLQKEEMNYLKLLKVAKPYILPGSSASHRIDFSTKHKKGFEMCNTAATEMSMEEDSPKQPAQNEKNTTVVFKVDTKDIDQYGLMIPCNVDSESDRKQQNVNKQTDRALSLLRRKPSQPASFSNLNSQISNVMNKFDPDFASWMPPEDQTGDGRTTLNEKLGY